jgi:outer membrane protein assembly factor BamB
MQNMLLRKGFAFGIVVLFFGTNITSNINGNIDEKKDSFSTEILNSKPILLNKEPDDVLSNPIYFTKNHGQFSQDVLFRTQVNGANVYFCQKKIISALYKYNETSQYGYEKENISIPFNREKKNIRPPEIIYVSTEFIGSTDQIVVSGENLLPHYTNYFIGNNSDKWYINVPNYERVTYHNIYPRIDLTYYGTANGLKYDFIIHPGADISHIQIHYSGVNNLVIGTSGNLQVHTLLGLINESTPIIYQKVNGKTLKVDGGYNLLESDVFCFQIETYNPMYDLIIDPGLQFSTFLGGSNQEYQNYGDIAVDSNGNSYIIGSTLSTDFPITPGSYDTIQNGNWDVFITKLSSSGNALLYSSFLGGNKIDHGQNIEVDANGYVYVIGTTNSSIFPTTTGTYDTTHNGYYDVFITKITPAGNELVYSTFLGGAGVDDSWDMALDLAGNTYLTGYTWSSNFPTSADAYDKTLTGSRDIFVTKLSPTGNTLIYSTYLGGWGGANYGWGIAVDEVGYAFITGFTTSMYFPTTAGAYDRTYNGNDDIFITKLSQSGNALIFSTFIGGTGNDDGRDITLDIQGNVCIVGKTGSSNFPITSNAYDATHNGDSDVIITILSNLGNALIYSTFIGGASLDWGNAITFDPTGAIYITGTTSSEEYPITTDAYDPTPNGDWDVFITKLTTDSGLIYSTFLGGSNVDYSLDIKIDTNGYIYLAGYTSSSNFPTTPGAYDRTYNGNGDFFITKMLLGEQPIDWWPMFRHDVMHSGHSSSSAPETNHILWFNTTGSNIESSPAVAEGKIFFGSGDNKFYCFDELDGTKIWSYQISGNADSSPAVENGKVFFGSDNWNLYCLNTTNGTLNWVYPTGETVSSSPAVVNGRVYFGSSDGRIYCLYASNGTKKWEYQIFVDCDSSPAIADGKVFIGASNGKLYCLNAENGTCLWEYQTSSSIVSSPAVAYQKVYFGAYNGQMYCLDVNNGNLNWNFSIGNYIYSSPAVAQGKVYFGGWDKKVYCLDAYDGSKKWEYMTDNSIWLSSPAIVDEKVYIGSTDKKIYCLRISDGFKIWDYATDNSVFSSPAIADGKLFVTSMDNKIYCFGNEETQPDLSITSTDIEFSKDTQQGNTVITNLTIYNYGGNIPQQRDNPYIEYWISDIYNDQESILKIDEIAPIPSGGCTTISQTFEFENPENHKLKVIVDPNNHISESNKNNNEAQKTISLTNVYKLTEVQLDDRLYYIMFLPASTSSANEVQTLFEGGDSHFVDHINRLWVVDSQSPNQPIDNINNEIGKIFYKISTEFYPEACSYSYEGEGIRNIDIAEDTANYVRNWWLLDKISPQSLLNFIKGVDKQDEQIKMFSEIVLGVTSCNKPKYNYEAGALGLGFSALSFIISLESAYSGDLVESADLGKLAEFFKEYIRTGTILVEGDIIEIKLASMSFMIDNQLIDFSAISIIIEHGLVTITPKTYAEMCLKQMIENNYIDFFIEILPRYLDPGTKSITFEEINKKIIEQNYYLPINRLRILRNFVDLYKNDAEDHTNLINAIDGIIETTKISSDTFIDTFVNPDPNLFKAFITPIIDATLTVLINKGVKVLFYNAIAYPLNAVFAGKSIAFGSFGNLIGTAIGTLALDIIIGLEAGFSLTNWDAHRAYAKVAKFSTQLGHYTIDIPAYALSKNANINHESFYSNAVNAIQAMLIGYSYYNIAMEQDTAFYIGGYFEWGKDFRILGDDCYSNAKKFEHQSAFELFNKLGIKCQTTSLFSIAPPDISTELTTKKTTHFLKNYKNIRLYCTNYDLMLDVITTKLDNSYLVTINPWENAKGIFSSEERVEQYQNYNQMKFKFFSATGNTYDAYWNKFYPTNRLHDKNGNTQQWYKSPMTVTLPWEPVSMEVEYITMDHFLHKIPWSVEDTFSLATLNLPVTQENEKIIQISNDIKSNKKLDKDGSISYETWDSDNDTLKDAMTIQWNISAYESYGGARVYACITNNNSSNNSLGQTYYVCNNFSYDQNQGIFTFKFYAVTTDTHNIYLFLSNSSTLETITQANISGIPLFSGPGAPSVNLHLFNITHSIYDNDHDNITDSISISFSLNSTIVNENNCSLGVICRNTTGITMKVISENVNLTTFPINYTNLLSNLNPDTYELTIYLANSGYQIQDSYQSQINIGENISNIFTEIFTDEGLDVNNNNLYDFLCIHTSIRIQETGNYTIEAILSNSSNTYIGTTKAVCNLTKGLDTITLNFNASLFSIMEKSDSYILTQISLYNETGTLISTYLPHYTTSFYQLSSFEQPPITFNSFNDTGVDSNYDGYYDYLQINTLVTFEKSGYYTFKMVVTNATETGSMIGWNTSYFSSGTHSVIFRYDGSIIRNSKQNTTYIIESIEINTNEDLYLGSNHPDWQTQYYQYIEFQPTLTILDTYSEQTIDMNDNGLYDLLKISIDVNVFLSGDYTICGTLTTANGVIIGTSKKSIVLVQGVQNISLIFDGKTIFRNKEITSFSLRDFKITTGDGNIAESRDIAYTTQVYNYQLFERSGEVTGECISDIAIDTDGNDLYDYLCINIQTNANYLGTSKGYLIRGYLYNSEGNFVGFSSNYSLLMNGTQTIPLIFLGSMINKLQFTGMFNLSSLQIYDYNNQLIFIDDTGYVTASYDSFLFEGIYHPPSTPSIPIPENGATNISINTNLSWYCDDPDGDNITYDIYFGTLNNPIKVSSNQTTRSFTPETMQYNTTYYWRIIAWDSQNISTYGSVWTFTTSINHTVFFGNPIPFNGSTNISRNIIWSISINDPEGDKFFWSIQCNNGQNNSEAEATNGTKILTLSNLSYNTTYLVWVNATDSNGSGIYKRQWYAFTTIENIPPLFGSPIPFNESFENPINITWHIPINDPEGDLISWTIQCDNGQTTSGINEINGTKSLNLPGLEYSTTYKIWVNATDLSGSGVYTRAWYTFTTENQSMTITQPSSYTIIRGIYVLGGLPDLYESDDQYLSILAGLTMSNNEPPVWLQIEGTAPITTPSQLVFTLEAHIGTPGVVTQTIKLFNYTSANFETIDSRIVTMTDQIVSIVLTNNSMNYIHPTTKNMLTQFMWKQTGPTSNFPWMISIDESNWIIWS